MPETPVGREVVAAVDVGGTRVKAALVDGSFDVVAHATTLTPSDIAADIATVVQEMVARLLVGAGEQRVPVRLVGAGVVVPGLVDAIGGVALYSVNLGWRDLPVREPVAASLGVPTVLGHDVRGVCWPRPGWAPPEGPGTRCS